MSGKYPRIAIVTGATSGIGEAAARKFAVADAIRFVVTRPPHVHVSDIVVRPTRQDHP